MQSLLTQTETVRDTMPPIQAQEPTRQGQGQEEIVILRERLALLEQQLAQQPTIPVVTAVPVTSHVPPVVQAPAAPAAVVFSDPSSQIPESVGFETQQQSESQEDDWDLVGGGTSAKP